MRLPGGLAFVAMAALAAAGGRCRAEAADSLSVARLDVRFPRESGATLAGRIELSADFSATPASLAFDPAADRLRVVVGPLVLLEGPAFPGRARVGRHGAWDVAVKVRGAFDGGGRLDFRMIRASGRVEVKARGVDLSPLLAAGPAGVRVAIEVGPEVFETTLDLDEAIERRWTLPGPGFIPPPPNTGGEGITWSPLFGGYRPGILAPQQLVIRDRATFDAFLLQLFGGTLPAGLPALDIDYGKDMVLAVIEGPGTVRAPGDALSAVWISSVALRPGELAAGFTFCNSTRGDWAGPVSPFHLARVTSVPWPVTFHRTAVPT